MDSPPPRIIRALASVPAFAGLDAARLRRLYAFTALKVLAKGEVATVAGVAVAELGIVVSGRVTALDGGPDADEFGPGEALEAEAFFTQSQAAATLTALRETVLLTLAWDDLMAAFHVHPDILASCFATMSASLPPPPARPARIALSGAGAKGVLDAAPKDALLAAFEKLAEVRVLRRDSFGSLALDAPETAHWLQEQELEFDLTLVIATGADVEFGKQAIEEADEVLFIANGGNAALSPLEQYALERRGKERCRLAIIKGNGITSKSAAEWMSPRSYRVMQMVDFDAPDAVGIMASGLLGKGNAVAAASRGVYAAAILGALQALEANGAPAVALAAAGSAVLPAGLLACGANLSDAEAIFRELANPLLWKRASRPDAGLIETAAIDNVLASALSGWEMALGSRPFASVALSLSRGAADVQLEGRLYGAVRAGLTPAGILPPLILDDGGILVSGENETRALVAAARKLSASPTLFFHPGAPPLGVSGTSYRQLIGGASFRLTPFSPSGPDKRVRLETVLGAVGGGDLWPPQSCPASHCFAIPIAEGITPMDWKEWARLRDSAFEWVSAEIVARELIRT